MSEVAIKAVYPSGVSISPDQFSMAVRQAMAAIKRGSEGRDVRLKRLEGGVCRCDPALSGDPLEAHHELLLVFDD